MPKPENIEPHKFKKGQSGNPKGRPKLPNLKEAMAEVLGEEKDGKTALQVIVAKLRQLAASGNLKAAEILLDRGYGKPQQHTDLTTNGKDIVTPEPLKVEIIKPDESDNSI